MYIQNTDKKYTLYIDQNFLNFLWLILCKQRLYVKIKKNGIKRIKKRKRYQNKVRVSIHRERENRIERIGQRERKGYK